MTNFILGINSALQNSSEVCLIKETDGNCQVLASKTWQNEQNELEKLIPAIAEICLAGQISAEEITKVFLVNGPGSFVSIRIAAVVANSIVQNSSKNKIYVLSTFEYLSKLCNPKENNQKNAKIACFAGGKQVYLYDVDTKKYETVELSEDELANLVEQDAILDLKNPKYNNIKEKSSRNSLSNVIIQLVENKLLDIHEVKDLPVLPNYIKEASITL